MKSFVHAICIAAAVLVVVPAHAEQQRRGGTEDQYAAIQAFHDDSVAKFNAGVIGPAVEDYLPQLRVAHTKGMSITGREGLVASWSKAFANEKVKPILVSEVIEMELNGDEIGDWSYILCDYASVVVDRESGKPTGNFSNGRYIALMEMTEDGWKVLLDIDNGAEGAAPHLEAQLKADLGL